MFQMRKVSVFIAALSLLLLPLFSAAQQIIILPQDTVAVQSFNLYALLPFSLGLILGVLAIVLDFGWFRKSLFLIIGGVLIFIGGSLTLLPATMSVVNYPAYNITYNGIVETVAAHNVTVAQPVLNASWGFAYEMSYWLIMLLYFILAVLYVLVNTKSKANRGNNGSL